MDNKRGYPSDRNNIIKEYFPYGNTLIQWLDWQETESDQALLALSLHYPNLDTYHRHWTFIIYKLFANYIYIYIYICI